MTKLSRYLRRHYKLNSQICQLDETEITGLAVQTKGQGIKMKIEFSRWLEKQLDKRDWTPSDLARASKRAGYKISRGQFSHILHGTRQAGPDACIAISSALGIPREEVFRARGWLLRTPQEVVPPNTSPKAAQVIRLLTELPLDAQEAASEALYGQLRVIRHFAGLGTYSGAAIPQLHA